MKFVRVGYHSVACWLLGFVCLPLAATAQTATKEVPAAIQLGAPFRDHAVLQRGTPVPVWGWSQPGTRVTVEFGGQSKNATADASGKWLLRLDPLTASFEPRAMQIRDGQGHRVTLEDLLVGEVWLASGQSNMQWKVAKSSCNQLQVEARGDVAPIREFEVTSVVAMLHPIEKADGAWKNGSYGDYSAIAFAFAHKLYETLQVPIGILNCSFSQTAIQAWVPREGFRDAENDYSRAIYQKICETDPSTPEHAVAWKTFYDAIETTLKENAGRAARGEISRAVSTKTPGNMNGNRDASWLFNGRLNPVVPYAIRGAIWNQGYANMGEGLPYYHNLHSLVRGWRMVWDRPQLPVYFHQFYSPGQKGEWNNHPSIGKTAEMRLGTWLARDIPHTGMASQIDITGGIHYFHKAVPGQRLARHALQKQYGKDIVADGPMFQSYQVKGSQLVVDFDHAKGGLVVAETGSNASRSNKEGTGFADPKVVENGAAQVALFYLADADRVWYPAQVKIAGEQVVLSSPQVKTPRGVAYGTNGIGFQPNLYNRALLPMTPFIYYDHQRVTSQTWPDEKLSVAGEVVDPSTVGKLAVWYKMPLLSTQFRSNAVLQAGVPLTFWGSVLHDYGYAAEGEAVVKFSFAGVEKTIRVQDGDPHLVELGPGQSRYPAGAKEWRVTLPPMPASAEPKTLKVTFLIDGEVAHERVCENMVLGDVWFVAAPPGALRFPQAAETQVPVRTLARKAKRFTSATPSRYSVCVSRTPLNRFACEWKEAEGFAAALGSRIAAKTGQPVGIVWMQSGMTSMGKGEPAQNLIDLKSWIPVEDLQRAPSLQADYRDLAGVVPGNTYYDANIRRYVAAWKTYWGEYVPAMQASRAVPDGLAWGSYPVLNSNVSSKAAEAYNVMVHSLTPIGLRGVVFLSSPAMVAEGREKHFGEQLSVLANAWKRRFGGQDVPFIYTVPAAELAPGTTLPEGIDGRSEAVEIQDWLDVSGVVDAVVK